MATNVVAARTYNKEDGEREKEAEIERSTEAEIERNMHELLERVNFPDSQPTNSPTCSVFPIPVTYKHAHVHVLTPIAFHISRRSACASPRAAR